MAHKDKKYITLHIPGLLLRQRYIESSSKEHQCLGCGHKIKANSKYMRLRFHKKTSDIRMLSTDVKIMKDIPMHDNYCAEQWISSLMTKAIESPKRELNASDNDDARFNNLDLGEDS
jgi:hypothetical protein